MPRHVAHVVKREMHIQFWLENLTGRENLLDLGIDVRII